MKIRNHKIRFWLNHLCELIGASWIAFPNVPQDNKVMFFNRDKFEFGFLSNFYPCEIVIDGKLWPHTEAYYQSQKSKNPDFHSRILEKSKPVWAKHVGDSRIGNPKIAKKSWFLRHPEDLRDDWDEIKVDLMKKALYAKFTQNKNLRQSLLNTMPADLLEDSTTDSFWGVDENNKGSNMLGKLLMELRTMLQKSAEQSASLDGDSAALHPRQ